MKYNEIKKLNMKSKNIINNNIDKIGSLFPNVIKEGKIDFNELKQELSDELIEENNEKYHLNWVGKNKAKIESNIPINKTLRPEINKSVNFDNTQNIYIEGDNLETLKILQESYLNKIDCIYIDPPYNTGNDFIYNDNFKKSRKIEDLSEGSIDEYNNKLISNNNSNGKFHSDWITMIYPRLKLARNLLNNEGVILISIDNNELKNMFLICDEIFGEKNFIANICWQKKTQPSFLSKTISTIKEYILVYSKNNPNKILTMGGFTDENKAIEMINISNNIVKRIFDQNNIIIENGKFNGILNAGIYGNKDLQIELLNSINVIDGKPQQDMVLKGRFKWSQEKMNQSFKEGDIYHIKNIKTLRTTVEKKNKELGIKPILDLLSKKLNNEIPTNTDATNEIKDIFNGYAVMDYPKPSLLIKYLIRAITYNKKHAIIMDFFSGSATTAHGVMLQNSEDCGKRKYIMVQIPEKIRENTSAYNQNLYTICDIGEERIRRAAKKIKEETNADIDYGFRVYKVDSSNMKNIYYEPSKLGQQQLNNLESNIKEDRTPEDLLTQVILDLGLTLDLKIEEKEILNNKVYFVAQNNLVACFDNEINIDIIDEICKTQPLKVVFRESSFKNDSEKINTYERIKKLSPETEINVL